MSQALYRTYRSRSLSEIVGQEHITATLQRSIEAGRISHAYLFTGPRGVGKTSVARILAHEINKLPYSETPHLDIIEIDAASNRRIDDIRELREKVYIAPVSARFKVYIIDEVHMLTGESFNALLKTLEEPPSHVVFILATTEVHKLPATIISRTQRFAFKPGTLEQIAAHLKNVAQKEKIKISDEALQLIAVRGDGSFRDSLSLLDQLSHISAGEITPQEVSQALGLAPREQISELLASLASDSKRALQIAQQLNSQGISVSSVVDQLTSSLLAMSIEQPHLLQLIDKLLEVPRAYNPHLKLLTTLAGFCAPKIASQIEKKPQAPAQKPQTVKTSEQPKPEAPVAEVNQTQPINDLSAEDWLKVLDAMRQKNPAIFAVLKQAQPSINGGELTLAFKYGLHSKKLDDVKQKALVAETLQATLGVSPVINVLIDKNAEPAKIAADPAIAAVAEIMGGGQPI